VELIELIGQLVASEYVQRGIPVDTIIFIVLLVAAVFAVRGAKTKIVVPIFLLGLVLTALLFNYHVSSALDLSF
jgi:hypothetical protein